MSSANRNVELRTAATETAQRQPVTGRPLASDSGVPASGEIVHSSDDLFSVWSGIVVVAVVVRRLSLEVGRRLAKEDRSLCAYSTIILQYKIAIGSCGTLETFYLGILVCKVSRG